MAEEVLLPLRRKVNVGWIDAEKVFIGSAAEAGAIFAKIGLINPQPPVEFWPVIV
ncbi:MAG: hypothetical protein U0S49_00645 [Rhodospirillales bacterium]|nr:hypothetical protein [Rhodospirillales bacterium]